jgi:hypothetical protein
VRPVVLEGDTRRKIAVNGCDTGPLPVEPRDPAAVPCGILLALLLTAVGGPPWALAMAATTRIAAAKKRITMGTLRLSVIAVSLRGA